MTSVEKNQCVCVIERGEVVRQHYRPPLSQIEEVAIADSRRVKFLPELINADNIHRSRFITPKAHK